MTTSEYENLTAREETQNASSRLFAFYRIRQSNNQTTQQSNNSSTTRFYPGDGAKLHFANRDVDTLEIPGVPSGYLAAGDVVTATYKGVCVFRGDVATIVESRGRGTDATQTVTCVGPWSKMQRLVYRQDWYTSSGYAYSSRLILNQHRDGTAQSLNSELTEIADHGATPCGYARGTVNVSTQILPFDECRDITVADAIKRELRLFPKAVTRFDYSTETPTLSIVKPSNLATPATASYVSAVPKTAREYVYNAHPITGVDLEIETSGTVEGVEYHDITHQRAGVTTSDNTTVGSPDCLYATLQIRGFSANATRQSFKSVTENIPENLNDVSWWRARHPRLANVASAAIEISEATRTPTTYPRISAATAGELEAAGIRSAVCKFTCKATITTTDDKEEDVYLTLNYLTTNATGTADEPKTYTWVTDSSSESGETVPTGLAAAILAERAGSLVSERMTVRLGDAFPRIGDAIAEDEGTVFLQSFDIDCGSLTADLSFGVPEYLSPEDMASLISNFRNKCTVSSGSMRSSGKAEDGDEIEMGAIPPLSSSEFAPGTKAKTTISDSGGGGKIVLDASALDEGETAEVHTLTVKGADGEDTEVKVVATEDVEIPSAAQITLVGGPHIVVEQLDELTWKISYDEDKEESDPEPEAEDEDPCEHDGGGGGVSPDDEESDAHGGTGADDDAGGVEAGDGETHAGDGCNTCG